MQEKPLPSIFLYHIKYLRRAQVRGAGRGKKRDVDVSYAGKIKENAITKKATPCSLTGEKKVRFRKKKEERRVHQHQPEESSHAVDGG